LFHGVLLPAMHRQALCTRVVLYAMPSAARCSDMHTRVPALMRSTHMSRITPAHVVRVPQRGGSGVSLRDVMSEQLARKMERDDIVAAAPALDASSHLKQQRLITEFPSGLGDASNTPVRHCNCLLKLVCRSTVQQSPRC